VALLLVAGGGAWAADGDLDPLWSGDGVVTIGTTDTVYLGLGIAVQCDGKVVVAGVAEAGVEGGELAVVRFNADGSLDSSFATNGLFTIALGFYGDSAWDVAIQEDGKIVVAGSSLTAIEGAHFLVLRLTGSGILDSTFSGDGLQVFNFDAPSRARALAVQDDGRIVVVGDTSTNSAMAVARLTSTGELDSTFSGDGKATIDFALGEDEGWDVAIQENGRILVAGTAAVNGGSVFAVVRLLSNGALDTSFGPSGSGATTIDFGAVSEGHAIILQRDGKIVVAGSTDTATSVAIARLTVGGLLDPSFSGDGRVTRDFNWGPDEGWDVAMQGDGRIIVAGSAYVDGLYYVALLRFTPDGAPDSSFGGYGYSLVSFGFDAFGRAVAVQPHDRKIVAAGFVETGVEDADLAVVRAIGVDNLIFAAGFECGGTQGWSSTVP
jgi:uncharacterized delta-60 repeat protein